MADWKLVKSYGSAGEPIRRARRSLARNADGAELYHLGRDIAETSPRSGYFYEANPQRSTQRKKR